MLSKLDLSINTYEYKQSLFVHYKINSKYLLHKRNIASILFPHSMNPEVKLCDTEQRTHSNEER